MSLKRQKLRHFDFCYGCVGEENVFWKGWKSCRV